MLVVTRSGFDDCGAPDIRLNSSFAYTVRPLCQVLHLRAVSMPWFGSSTDPQTSTPADPLHVAMLCALTQDAPVSPTPGCGSNISGVFLGTVSSSRGDRVSLAMAFDFPLGASVARVRQLALP